MSVIIHPSVGLIEIIPTILVGTLEEARARSAAVEGLADWVQIDVVDGTFAENITWGNPGELAAMHLTFNVEVDLMVTDPERRAGGWIAAGVSRIFFHQEALENRQRANALILQVRKAGVEAGMSLNPATSHEVLFPFVPQLDCVLLLGVEPGFGGQAFQEPVLQKIRALRERFPFLPIEIDGGVNAANARRIVEAGATRLCVGSFVFQHPKGPKAAIEELRFAVESRK